MKLDSIFDLDARHNGGDAYRFTILEPDEFHRLIVSHTSLISWSRWARLSSTRPARTARRNLKSMCPSRRNSSEEWATHHVRRAGAGWDCSQGKVLGIGEKG